ncbi:50S ribosomal protein L6 [Nanobdella aerobiophila]|uniref:50S ribosomal protein L6 n=1 Tax=Nanobdella aerobiophila TaxID=2586965 RepID=A0A915ST14_9ARCH|nr:hypothetical protein [Nanobdella aerobiophila]BBL45801.1 50S ribosomal protein L6 [Nanobdella aerobiophila]
MRSPVVMEKIKIPENIDINIDNNKIILKGNKGTIERKINDNNIIIIKENDYLVIKAYFPSKRIIKNLYTLSAHLRNDINGLVNGYRYILRSISVHFPLKIKLDKNNKLLIENYMGGRDIKEIEIPKDIKINIKENEISIEGYNIELLGNLAGLIENSVRPKEKDLRKFQDGIFIVKKP